MKRICSLLLAFLMLCALAACGGGSDTPTGTDAPETGAPTPDGGEAAAQYYNVYMAADPTSMDISRVSDTYSGTVISNVMEGLVRMGEADGDYVMLPGDAQSWEQSEDGLTWTFHLGDNYWSDGEPVTAEQYVYSLQRSVDPATGSPNAWFFFAIEGYDEICNGAGLDTLGVRALDEKTLEISLIYPMPSFLDMCAGSNIFIPLRQDVIEQYGDQYGTEADMCVYNGPYVLSEWVHNSKLVLTKNPHYWDADNVQIETVTISIMSDATTRLNAYETGSLDYVATSDAEWMEKFLARDDSVYVQSSSASLEFAFFNTRDALFQNANIRKAFTLALDREEANEMCFGGTCIPTYGWICPALSVGATNFREYAGDTIQDMIDEMAAEDMTARDYLLLGMEELDLGDDPATLDVTFSLAGTSDWFRTFGEYLQQTYLHELGVNMEISFSEWGIFSNNLANGNYQIGYMSWGAYYNDPYDMLSLFYSDWDSIGTGWANEEYDALVTQALQELDDAKRLELYKQAEDILIREECVACPVITAASNAFFKDFVEGYSTLNFTMTGYKGMSTGGR